MYYSLIEIKTLHSYFYILKETLDLACQTAALYLQWQSAFKTEGIKKKTLRYAMNEVMLLLLYF